MVTCTSEETGLKDGDRSIRGNNGNNRDRVFVTVACPLGAWLTGAKDRHSLARTSRDLVSRAPARAFLRR